MFACVCARMCAGCAYPAEWRPFLRVLLFAYVCVFVYMYDRTSIHISNLGSVVSLEGTCIRGWCVYVCMYVRM